MIKSRNINMEKVREMAEGDLDFQKELLQAISLSVLELKEKYHKAITLKDEDLLHQARHKVKPTVTIFELRNLSAVLEDGRELIRSLDMDDKVDGHWKEFSKVTEDLLKEIEEMQD